ncbi:hypothetical protein AD940_11610 [Gluconobacter thailandicus]|nr:hypothetical protein AD940_11610 [Gluconobacter thailandicus]
MFNPPLMNMFEDRSGTRDRSQTQASAGQPAAKNGFIFTKQKGTLCHHRATERQQTCNQPTVRIKCDLLGHSA